MQVAKEYEGRVAFIKVDVQRSYVGVQIRSMPTFHFYLQAGGRTAHARSSRNTERRAWTRSCCL